MQLAHKHLIIRAEVPESKRQPSEKELKDWLVSLIGEINMELAAGPYTVQEDKDWNSGITAIAIITPSHISFHLWDKTGLLQMDVYSCAEFKPETIFKLIKRDFEAKIFLRWCRSECCAFQLGAVQ